MADKILKNFDVQLTDLDGEVLTDPVIKDGQPTGERETVKPINRLIAQALQIYALKDGEDGVKIWDWALTFQKGGDINLERDDYNKIKEIVKKAYASVIIQAQIIKLLDA